MIKDNYFYVENLKSIVFIGYSKLLPELIKFNNNNKISSKIITSTDQSTDITVEFKIFNKIDEAFYKYLRKEFNIKSTLFISLGSRLIFDSKAVDFFSGNLINFSTRLPYDSGGGGSSWKIMRNDRIDNQLVHIIDEGIDTGPIIKYSSSLYPKDCLMPKEIDNYSLEKFFQFYCSFISDLIEGKKFLLKPQVKYIGRYNPRLSTLDNGFIDWKWEPLDLLNFINSFDEPYQGSMTYINRGNFGPVHLKSVQLHGGDSSNHPYMAGLVSRHDKDWIVVCTSGKYSLIIEKIIDSSGNNIIDKIKPGDRFFTPSEILDQSNSKRITYNSKGKVK